jgi:hypothetical protein
MGQKTGLAMPRFFPDARQVAQARQQFAQSSFSDVNASLSPTALSWPQPDDLPHVISEFSTLASELGWANPNSSFVVLLPIRVNGARHTTPVLVDVERQVLAFASHPTFGAGVIPDTVIAENANLAAGVREGLLGVLATWQNLSA